MTTQVKRDGSDDLHRRKTEPVENYPTPMNTVDTEQRNQIKELLVDITTDYTSDTLDEVIDIYVDKILAISEALTNEAELRGRQAGYMAGVLDGETKALKNSTLSQEDLDNATAALLKLSSASSRKVSGSHDKPETSS
jgi:hypothetical protein